jgi:hypothetical protein
VSAASTAHPWHGMRLTAGWGSRDLLDFTPVQPVHVVAFAGDVAIDDGRWRRPVRLLHHQPDTDLGEVPRFGARPSTSTSTRKKSDRGAQETGHSRRCTCTRPDSGR